MKINKILLVLMLLISVLQSDVQSNMVQRMLTSELEGSEGNTEVAIDALLKKIEDIGYSIVAANRNLQVHFYNKYHEKNVEMISFFSVVNKEKMRPLLLKNPDFGAYAPFNFLVYKTLDTKNDNNTWYGHIASGTMLDIIGEKDPALRKEFTDIVATYDTLVTKEMDPDFVKIFEHTKPLPVHGLTKFVKKFEAVEDMEEFIEEFISDHDGRFAKHEFVIAGFIDFKFEYDDMDLDFDKYDAYWVSLLCHFEFSNAIFNRGVPEGGMFAPCSIYFYIPKGTNELHVGYASVDNWVNALNFKDQDRVDYMKAIDAEVVEIFGEMGFKKVDPSASKADVSCASKDTDVSALKAQLAKMKAELAALKKTEKAEAKKPVEKVVKTAAVPLSKKTFKTAKFEIDSPRPAVFSAYYAAQPQTVAGLKAKLEANGFKVLSTHEVLKGNTVLTVTNSQLQATNSFLATLNVHVNGTDEVRVQNPTYFAAAYLQDKFKYGQFKETLKSLQAALGDMYEVGDKFKFKELSDYQFMFGMPYFDDTIEVAEGSDLLEKLSSKKAQKYVAYILTLPNGSILVGHKLRSRTNKFLKKITAERNANILPYQSLIKGKKAVILDPKYYLSLSLPLLTMSDFMKIASAPGEIEKDIIRAYK